MIKAFENIDGTILGLLTVKSPNGIGIDQMNQLARLMANNSQYSGSNILRFNKKFPDGTNHFDIEFTTSTPKYGELKSWGACAERHGCDNISQALKDDNGQFVNGYLANATSLDDFVYNFDIGKITIPNSYIANFPAGTPFELIQTQFVKEQWQKYFRGTETSGAFQYNIFDAFWNNPSLRNSLWGPTLPTQTIAFTQFQNWVETLDNKLFKFIKVE